MVQYLVALRLCVHTTRKWNYQSQDSCSRTSTAPLHITCPYKVMNGGHTCRPIHHTSMQTHNSRQSIECFHNMFHSAQEYNRLILNNVQVIHAASNMHVTVPQECNERRHTERKCSLKCHNSIACECIH